MDSLHFYIALFFHLTFLILGFGSVMVIDATGILMLRKKISLDRVKKTAAITQPLIWAGWLGMVVSGVNLIYLKGYIDNLTWVKLFLVALLGLNGIFLHLIKKGLSKASEYENLSKIFRFRIFLTTAISQTGWWGALFIGFIHRHIAHNISWPNSPFQIILPLISVFLVVWILGEIWLNKKFSIKK